MDQDRPQDTVMMSARHPPGRFPCIGSRMDCVPPASVHWEQAKADYAQARDGGSPELGLVSIS